MQRALRKVMAENDLRLALQPIMAFYHTVAFANEMAVSKQVEGPRFCNVPFSL